MGIQNDFRETKPLYNGEFHRAVLKGRTDLLQTIENGFTTISKSEYEAIDKRWMGASLTASPYLLYAVYCLGAIAVLVMALMFWLWGLKKAVTLKTRELTHSYNLLQTIINTVPMRIFWKDTELRYVGCNQAFAEDAGAVCPEDLIGKDDYQLTGKIKQSCTDPMTCVSLNRAYPYFPTKSRRQRRTENRIGSAPRKCRSITRR